MTISIDKHLAAISSTDTDTDTDTDSRLQMRSNVRNGLSGSRPDHLARANVTAWVNTSSTEIFGLL